MSLKSKIVEWLEIKPSEDVKHVRPDDKFADFIDRLSNGQADEIIGMNGDKKIRVYKTISKLSNKNFGYYQKHFLGDEE